MADPLVTIAFLIFAAIPLAFCAWAFWLQIRERGEIGLPNGDATETPTMLRNVRRLNWRK